MSGGGADEVVHLSAVSVAAALLLALAVQVTASVAFSLGIHLQLVVAAVRAVVQLSVLGFILVRVDVQPALSLVALSILPCAPHILACPRRWNAAINVRQVPIFTSDKLWVVLLYAAFMTLTAVTEAVQRPRR